MANPEHVARLKEGAEAWNAWRKATGTTPNLSRAQLFRINLSGCNLSRVYLDRATLSMCVLHGTRFSGSALDETRL